jgi:hypothetical protein
MLPAFLKHERPGIEVVQDQTSVALKGFRFYEEAWEIAGVFNQYNQGFCYATSHGEHGGEKEVRFYAGR